MKSEKDSADKVVNEITKLRNFLKYHEKYKEQWKHVVQELLEKLSDKIIRLLVENYKLKQKHHHPSRQPLRWKRGKFQQQQQTAKQQ